MSKAVLESYPEAVAKLAELGEPAVMKNRERWPDYLAMGLSQADVGKLIRMVEDPVLNMLPADSTGVWAPFHAARALGQLGAVEMAPRLLKIISEYPSDDYMHEEIPYIMVALGPEVIPALVDFIADRTVDPFARNYVIEAIEQVGKAHPEAKDRCVAALENQLARHYENHSAMNGFIINSLVNLKATQTIETIRKAFAEEDAVDIGIMGDLEDVEIAMGLRLFRETPPPKYSWCPEYDPQDLFKPIPPASGMFAHNPYKNVGRNAPCPCGSGKKFKKCCLQ